MTDVAVEPHVLFDWATGPVDAVGDELDSAYSTLKSTSEAGGLSGALETSHIAATLARITDHDGGWGQDERYTRGRVYAFANALMDTGHNYATDDDANSWRIMTSGFPGIYDPNSRRITDAWESDFHPGAEPSELGQSQPYQD